jgi:Alpha/beta hydrolase domain
LFVALEEWVTKGVEPPPSRVPRVTDGTAVMAGNIKMPAVPGFALAPGANQIVPPVDWVDPPTRIDNVYGARVSAVDADGNEIAGIRLPPIAVALGTHTGWNVYRAEPRELADRDGSLIPFARTKAEREAAGDPRPSLEERHQQRSNAMNEGCGPPGSSRMPPPRSSTNAHSLGNSPDDSGDPDRYVCKRCNFQC